jgi:hypothetical protein
VTELLKAHEEWVGKTIVCIAGGSSLTQDQCNKVSHLPTIGVNDAYRIARLDVLYACDHKWWVHHNGVPEFSGLKITQSTKSADEYGIALVQIEGFTGLNRKQGYVCGGGNGGHQALNIAYHFKPKKIILLGYDMKGKHWFGDHPGRLKSNSPYGQWVENFRHIAREITKEVEVINCSPDSALDCFEKSKLEDSI